VPILGGSKCPFWANACAQSEQVHMLKLGIWHIPLGDTREQVVVDAVPLGAVEAGLVVIVCFQQPHDNEAFEGAAHGVEGPEGEVLFMPVRQTVAHPTTAVYLFAAVGRTEPVVDLLQNDGFVEADEAGQGGQHLQRGFVDQEFTHFVLHKRPLASGRVTASLVGRDCAPADQKWWSVS